MFNKWIGLGRVATDVETRFTQAGKQVANFRVATGTKEEPFFIGVVAWERLAETCVKYLSKGRVVLVEGRLTMRTYDAQDGTKRTVYEVHAQTVRFLPDGKQQGGGQSAPQQGGSFGGEFDPDDDEDVPF